MAQTTDRPHAPAATCAMLAGDEEAAWFGLLAVRDALVKEIDAELQRGCHLPRTEFDALFRVARAQGERLGMGELAAELRLSQSGLSRLVDRLEQEGLLRRETSEADARAVLVALTDAGRSRLHEAATLHVDVVRRLFLVHFSPAELAALAGFWARVAPERGC